MFNSIDFIQKVYIVLFDDLFKNFNQIYNPKKQ